MLKTCLACSYLLLSCRIGVKRYNSEHQHDVRWCHAAVESRPQQASPPQLRPRAAQPGIALCCPAVRGAERRPLVAPTAWRGCQKNPW